MLKKMLALTLALVMAIMPMTASAVTWGDVVKTLNSGSNYNKDNVEAYIQDGEVHVSGGEITANEGETVIVITQVDGGNVYYFEGVKLNADQIKAEAGEEFLVVGFMEGTVVNGDVVVESKGEYGHVEFGNLGTINGDMTVTGTGSNYNEGTVVGDMTVTGTGNNYNEGTVVGDMTVTGSGSNYNSEDATAGNMTVTITGEEAVGGNMNAGTAGDMTAIASGKDSEAYNVNAETAGNMTVTVTGEGTFGGNRNAGTAGDMNAVASGESSQVQNVNEKTAEGDMTVIASGKDSEASNVNAGTAGDMNAVASGESSLVQNVNFGTAGNMNATASGKGSVVGSAVTGGTVTGSMNTVANAEGAIGWNIVEEGYDDDDNAVPSDVSNVTASASNGGTVVNTVGSELDSLTAVIGEGGKVIAGYIEGEYDEETNTETLKLVTEPEAVNKEKVSNITIVIEAGAEDTYTAEQIKAMIEATGMEPDTTVYYTVNGDGERTAEYSIGADGSLTFVRKLIEEYTAEELEYIKKMDKIARENHEREVKRHAEKLGGITASPEWVKQLFLGYMSLNLRMYEEGEQILFRERLAWADTDDGTLNLTLRVNIAEPKALTIRLDENVLDKLEQANISVITLLAKDGTPVMQYKVSDLRGAYTQYGLSGTDLLVVGGADDAVMKIGADGVMKPVEAE